MSAPDLLWRPPEGLGPSLRSHQVMVDRGRMCFITGRYLTMLALNPSVVTLGWADATKLSAAASGNGAWAFAVNIPSAKSVQPTVVLVESSGEARQHQIRKEKESLE